MLLPSVINGKARLWKHYDVHPCPPDSLDLHLMTCGSSPKPKWNWKVNVCNLPRAGRQPQQCDEKPERKSTSRTALDSGKDDGTSMLEVRGDFEAD